MRSNQVHTVALGGILAAIAMVIMCLGGLIPVATFICPMLCIIAGHLVLRRCGRRIAWAWYVAVSILSLLLGPDKESAAVYCFLGFYPYVKGALEKRKSLWIGKLILFNAMVGIMYSALIHLFGMEQLVDESKELGVIGLLIMLLLGNVTFFLLDRLLSIIDKKL